MLLPLALIAWHDERARLLFGMALMQQRFYDPLMLWLIPETARGALVLSALSWVVCGPWLFFATRIPLAHPQHWIVVGLLYLPALLMVLWRARSAARAGTRAPAPQLAIGQPQPAQDLSTPRQRGLG